MSPPFNISVVEDDDSLRRALVDLLATFDYRVTGFASAEEFLSEASIDDIDCLVTDIHMPGLSGLELKARLSAARPALPVIMITARAERQLEEKIEASGAFGMLLKPLDSGRLIDMIERATRAI